mgnify:CR=1 FL=1
MNEVSFYLGGGLSYIYGEYIVDDLLFETNGRRTSLRRVFATNGFGIAPALTVRSPFGDALAIDVIFHKGVNQETYNVGGFNEWKNIDLVKLLCEQMDEKLGRPQKASEKLITYVKDRPGHDLRYAINANKIKNDLAWQPSVSFKEGLSKTIDWYLKNKDWLQNVTSGNYKNYYQKKYKKQD